MESESVFIVLGKKQNASPDDNGNWTNYWSVDVVGVFRNREDANIFIRKQKLAEAVRPVYGDICYYENGYYSMDIQEWEVE